jgi:hypothetical protein
VTGGQLQPLWVAGVAGGAGTSTWTRILHLQFPTLLLQDMREYRGGPVDMLVTNNTAASAARVGPALAHCPRPPLLVVMHTAPFPVAGARSHLRKTNPHVVAQIDIDFRRAWLEMEAAPGPRLPLKARDLAMALNRFVTAMTEMYPKPENLPTPPREPAAQAPVPIAPLQRPSAIPARAGPPPPRWMPPPGGLPAPVPYRGGPRG